MWEFFAGMFAGAVLFWAGYFWGVGTGMKFATMESRVKDLTRRLGEMMSKQAGPFGGLGGVGVMPGPGSAIGPMTAEQMVEMLQKTGGPNCPCPDCVAGRKKAAESN